MRPAPRVVVSGFVVEDKRAGRADVCGEQGADADVERGWRAAGGGRMWLGNTVRERGERFAVQFASAVLAPEIQRPRWRRAQRGAGEAHGASTPSTRVYDLPYRLLGAQDTGGVPVPGYRARDAGISPAPTYELRRWLPPATSTQRAHDTARIHHAIRRSAVLGIPPCDRVSLRRRAPGLNPAGRAVKTRVQRQASSRARGGAQRRRETVRARGGFVHLRGRENRDARRVSRCGWVGGRPKIYREASAKRDQSRQSMQKRVDVLLLLKGIVYGYSATHYARSRAYRASADAEGSPKGSRSARDGGGAVQTGRAPVVGAGGGTINRWLRERWHDGERGQAAHWLLQRWWIGLSLCVRYMNHGWAQTSVARTLKEHHNSVRARCVGWTWSIRVQKKTTQRSGTRSPDGLARRKWVVARAGRDRKDASMIDAGWAGERVCATWSLSLRDESWIYGNMGAVKAKACGCNCHGDHHSGHVTITTQA
ncbi:hypothetical protein C8R44DRAFT_943196 [Mycena epipterygia]|nr:hypothetical protein C8R44DRAFT_943196 [Mycena epipterygia]